MQMNETKLNPVNCAAIAMGETLSHAVIHRQKEKGKQKKKDMRGRQDRETCWMERTLCWRSFQCLIKDGRRGQTDAFIGRCFDLQERLMLTLAFTFKYYPFICPVSFLCRPGEVSEGARGGCKGVRGGLIVPRAQSHHVNYSDCWVLKWGQNHTRIKENHAEGGNSKLRKKDV